MKARLRGSRVVMGCLIKALGGFGYSRPAGFLFRFFFFFYCFFV